jgi:hypothetical protein
MSGSFLCRTDFCRRAGRGASIHAEVPPDGQRGIVLERTGMSFLLVETQFRE